MNANEFPNEALKKYYPQPDIHRLYIGEIISDLKVSIE